MADRPMIVEHHDFVKAMAKSLRHHCGVRAADRLLLAVSGGADSVALLRAAAALMNRRKWQLQLAVGHVQHHLRGQAEADAWFVKQLAEQLGVEYLRADLDLNSGQLAQGNLEARARRGRYAALAKMAKQFGATCVATAHHSDDQLETVLMRLMRGTSVTGLAGMAWQRRLEENSDLQLIRPMLAVGRTMVLNFLQHINQPWREDHTNADVSRLRAKLRRDVLPVLREINEHTARRAVTLGEDIRSLRHVIDDAMARARDQAIIQYNNTQVVIDREKASELPKMIVGQLLRDALSQMGINLDSLGKRTVGPMVQAVYDGKGGERRFLVSEGVSVMITRDKVTIAIQ